MGSYTFIESRNIIAVMFTIWSDCSDLFLLSNNQLHLPHFLLMCLPGSNRIDTGGVDAGMPQKIRKRDNILLHTVKYAREKMPKIMWEDLRCRHSGIMTQRLHGAPDAGSVQRASALRHKDTAVLDSPTLYVSPELFAKLGHQKDSSRLPFTADTGLAALHRVYRNVCQFADSDPRTADGLEDQGEPLVTPTVSGGHKAHILPMSQLLFFGIKGFPLDTESLDSKLEPTAKAEEGIQGCQH